MLSMEKRHAKWRGLLADQRRSGLTVTAWCYKSGIQMNTFYGWRKRLSAEPVSVSPQFIPVALAAEPIPAGLTLMVGHVSVEINPGFDRNLLADVLGVLEARNASVSLRC